MRDRAQPAWDAGPRAEGSADPLDALEQRIEAVLQRFESGAGSHWREVEELLTDGYGRLLAVEAVCARLDRKLDAGSSPPQRDPEAAAERRELEQFRHALGADATRLRMSLGRFKARGLEARRRLGLAA